MKTLFKFAFTVLVILVVLAFIGVKPLAGYKNTIVDNWDGIVDNAQSTLAAPSKVNGDTKSPSEVLSMAGIKDKVATFFGAISRVSNTLVSPAPAKVSIVGVAGDSTFVVQVEPNKNALDFEDMHIYSVILTAKDGYIFQHTEVSWVASEFEPREDSRAIQTELPGLRVLRLSAPPMDKAIFPMRQEISQLVAEKHKKKESDFLKFYWDGASLGNYDMDELRAKYTVSDAERAAIARKYVDVRIMTYDNYLILNDETGQ